MINLLLLALPAFPPFVSNNTYRGIRNKHEVQDTAIKTLRWLGTHLHYSFITNRALRISGKIGKGKATQKQ